MTFQTGMSAVPDRRAAYQSDELFTPLGDALGAQGKLSMMDWVLERISHSMEVDEAQRGKRVSKFRGPVSYLTPTSRALTLAEAEQQVREAGVEGRVKVFEGQREAALKLEIEREQTKQKYEQIVAHADPGIGTQILIGATGAAVDFADPVNLATMAVPAAGAAKVAIGLTKATSKLAPLASKIIVQAGTGAYEGAVSTALAEPVNYAVHQSLGDDYGLADSVKNVLTNAAGGAALKVIGGAGLDLYRGMRMRPGPGGTIRVVAEGAQQIGELDPVKVTGPAEREQAALARATPQSSQAVEAPTKKRTGLGYARNSVLVMPASGAPGSRVTDSDLVGLKTVLREYDPVVSAGGGGTAASAVDIFRIERDADLIIYTRLRTDKGSPDTFTVERIRANEFEPGAALSKKKANPASNLTKDEDYVLYFHPPQALAARFAEAFPRKLTELEQLTRKELYLRFQPSERKGHTIDTEIGQALHNVYKDYTLASAELRLIKQENGARPDSGLVRDELNADLKRDTPRGRRSGQETWRKYWERLNQSTAIPLYDDKLYAARIAALKQKVAAAWKNPEPSWVAEREAREAAAILKAGSKPKKHATSKTKGVSQARSTRNRRKMDISITSDLPGSNPS